MLIADRALTGSDWCLQSGVVPDARWLVHPLRYRPQLGRGDVVALLKGKATGAFCVRDSASQPGCYALSVSVSPKADKLWTGLITPTDDGRGGVKYRLFVKQKFDTVADLIEFYHSNACVTIDKGKREVVLKDVQL